MPKESIVISDAIEKIKEEIQQLQLILAALTAERDDLKYHICPELTARYAREIGEYEHRLKCQRIMILEMKRRIEIARAALNREKTISREAVDQQVEKEYEEFHQKVDEEYQKAQEAKQEQERREQQQRQYQQQWQEKYGGRKGKKQAGEGNSESWQSEENGEANGDGAYGGNGDTNGDETCGSTGVGDQNSEQSENNRTAGEGTDGQNASQSTEDAGSDTKEMPNPKEMFRKIVKKLHPDMNPDITEREKELFSKAVKAYQDGDVVTLQEIYDEVFGDGSDAPVDKEMSYDDLVELRDKLKDRIEEVKEEIEDIKASFPYTRKEFLDDEDAVAAEQKKLEDLIHKYEDTWKDLTKMLQDINEEMEALKHKQTATQKEV